MKRRLTSAVTATALAMSGWAMTLPAYGQDRQDLVDQQEENERRITELQSSLEGVDVDLQQAFLDLEETRGLIPDAEAELAQAENDLASAVRQAEANAALLTAAQSELETISGEIEQNEDAADTTRYSLAEIARATYRGETVPSAIDLVLGSTSPEEYANAFRVNSAVTRTQTAALTQLEQEAATNKNREARQLAVEERVTELKAEADQLVVVTEQARAEASERKAELESLEASIVAQTDELESKRKIYEASIETIEADNKSVAQRIAEIDEENRRKEAERQAKMEAQSGSRPSGSSGSSGGSSASSSGSTSTGNFFAKPIPGSLWVTSPWGWRNHPFGGRAMHQGVDLASACGDPQYASAPGTVVKVIPASVGYTGGNMVYINHGIVSGSSYVTTHMHLSRFNVSVGQTVNRGDLIGWTGATGRVTGCHVHFEVWKNGSTINPMGLPGF